jgi:hypothetical protein
VLWGDTTVTGSQLDLDGINDVALTSPSVGQTLIYDGTSWVNAPLVSRNYLLNGGFDFWQRGTSFTVDGYTADRWYFDETGTCTVTQDTSTVPSGFNFALNVVATTVNDSGDIYQCLEAAVVKPLRGKTVTFSCYLVMDADMRAQSGSFNLIADYSNSTDARASQTTSIGEVTLDKSLYSSYARASYTFTVPADAVGLKVGIEPPLTVSPVTSAYWVAGAQLELGSIATPFTKQEHSTELAACQRYFYRWNAEFEYEPVSYGLTYTSTAGMMPYYLPCSPRVLPTVTSSGSWRLLGGSGTVTSISGVYGALATSNPIPVAFAGTSLAGSGIITSNVNAASYIDFNMEL